MKVSGLHYHSLCMQSTALLEPQKTQYFKRKKEKERKSVKQLLNNKTETCVTQLASVQLAFFFDLWLVVFRFLLFWFLCLSTLSHGHVVSALYVLRYRWRRHCQGDCHFTFWRRLHHSISLVLLTFWTGTLRESLTRWGDSLILLRHQKFHFLNMQ